MSNHIKKFTQEQKDAAKLGAEGGLGLVAGTIGRIGKAFGNTAKQYLKGFKNPAKQQTPRPTSTFKPFHRDGRIYDRQAINDAFKARFRPEATITPKMPKIETRTMTKDMFGRKFIGRDVTPPNTNFGRADAQVKMREAYRNLRK